MPMSLPHSCTRPRQNISPMEAKTSSGGVVHRSYLPHQLLHFRLNRFGPDAVALLIEMQEIGHHFLAQRAIGFQELSPNVEIIGHFVVGQELNTLVGAFIYLPLGVLLASAAGK